MTRLPVALVLVAIVAASAAFAQSTPPVRTATVDNVKVSGAAATTSMNTESTGNSMRTNLIEKFLGAAPKMPVLSVPPPADPNSK